MRPEYTSVQIAAGGLDENFSYIVKAQNGDTAVIDPCGDVAKIKRELDRLAPCSPKYILLTHGHHDHVSGLKQLKAFFNAPLLGHPRCMFPCEKGLSDNERLPFGEGCIECIHTPGHSQDSVCYRLSDDSALFTGDTLFIDCCGYCEAKSMFKTMRERIYPLPDSLEVYSGHNYGHAPHESLGSQKLSNPYLNTGDFEEFKRRLKVL